MIGAPYGAVMDLCPCPSFLWLPVRTFPSLSSRAHRLLASPLGTPSTSLAWDVLAGEGHPLCSGDHANPRATRGDPPWVEDAELVLSAPRGESTD